MKKAELDILESNFVKAVHKIEELQANQEKAKALIKEMAALLDDTTMFDFSDFEASIKDVLRRAEKITLYDDWR